MENASTPRKAWSWRASNFCVAVLTFAIGIATHWASTFLPLQSATQQSPPEASHTSSRASTLKERIREAKANGRNTLELDVLGCGWDIGSLQEALSRDTVVLADLIGKKTYENTDGLYTWYKFKTRETLVEHPYPLSYLEIESVPSAMFPVAEDEFLIQEVNGQMVIDGVTVTQNSNGAKYSKGQTYLLFLWIEPSKRTAIRTGTDPLGVFLVDSDGHLKSYIDRPYPLKTNLGKRFKSSINNLRQSLKKLDARMET